MAVATPTRSRRSSADRVLQAFPENLRAARIAAGMTQGELAAKVCMSQGQISHYETGRREPTLSEACRLADAVGVTIADLIETQ